MRVLRERCVKRRLLLFIAVAVLGPAAASAVPNFARKYELSCNVCHTRIPRLNSFGQRFQENGYQLPGTEDGGETKKKHFGSRRNPVSPDSVSNFLSARFRADFQQVSLRQPTGATEDPDFVVPNIINLFIAGTATKNISFFLEGEFAPGEGGDEGLTFERTTLLFSNLGPRHQALNLKIGVFDPSAYFAFPTHRQQMGPIFARAETEGFPAEIDRIPIVPLAFSSKMFGLTRGPEMAGEEGFAILPFEPTLFNSPAELGMAIYGRPLGQNFFYQVGVVQDETASDLVETRYDTHLMLRYDMPVGTHRAAQISGFYYNAPDAARPALAPGGDVVFATEAVDWTRYGLGARIQYKFFDIYGTAVWDEIDEPLFDSAPLNLSSWETKGLGVSLEADWLVNESWLVGVRYDFMNPGGLSKLPPTMQGDAPKINQTVSFIGAIAKYYPVPNIGLYVRSAFSLDGAAELPPGLGGAANPARNLSSFIAFGVDMAF